MPARILPPKVLERRSDERDVFRLLNALRDAYSDLTSGGGTGRAYFSAAIGRGDSTNTTTGNEDSFILQWQLPAAFPAFSFGMGGMLLSASTGSPVVRARLGGAWNTFDGIVIAEMGLPVGAPVNTLVDVSTTGNLVTLNTATLLKLTLQSAAPAIRATAVGMFVIGN